MRAFREWIGRARPIVAYRLRARVLRRFVSTTWRAAVEQRRAQTYQGFAGARGVTPAAYRATMEENVRRWVGTAEVRTRVPRDAVGLIVADGRLMNQFETGASRGAPNLPVRAQLENRLF